MERAQGLLPRYRTSAIRRREMNVQLFLLSLRRALHPGTGVALAAVAALVLTGRGITGDAARLEGAALSARGLLRSDLSFALLFVLVPILLAGAARVFPRLAEGERYWLIPRSASKASIALSTFAGSWLGALLWLAAIGGLCESFAGGDASSLQASAPLELEDRRAVGEEIRVRWTSQLPARPEGCVVRLAVGVYGSYNEIEAFELAALTSEGDVYALGSAAPGRVLEVEVPVPAAGERVEFELYARGAERSIVLNRPRLQLYVPRAERWSTWLVLGEVALMLGAALALALGCGPWLSVPSVLLFLLGGYALLWLELDALGASAFGEFVLRVLPGAQLPESFAQFAEGRSPQSLAGSTWLGGLALIALGLAAFHRGLGRWRAGA